ncbi:MAG: hypothetical protein V1676_02730 [Candidatus Diapherotrites archaeon]
MRSLLLFGNEYEAVHKFMDAAAKVLGTAHRILGHGNEDIDYIRKRWGDEAALAAQQHVIDDLRDTNKKLLEVQKKSYNLNPLVVFWWIIKGSAALLLVFAVISIMLLPIALDDALKQQSPEHQQELASLRFDANKYSDGLRKAGIANVVKMGRALPEEYGETYESLGIDESKAKEAARLQDEIKNYVWGSKSS